MACHLRHIRSPTLRARARPLGWFARYPGSPQPRVLRRDRAGLAYAEFGAVVGRVEPDRGFTVFDGADDVVLQVVELQHRRFAGFLDRVERAVDAGDVASPFFGAFAGPCERGAGDRLV